MSKNQRSMPKNVLTTLALAGMMFGVVVAPAMAAPGDFYDTNTNIHFSVPLSDSSKTDIMSAYTKGDDFAKESGGGVYLDYNKAYASFAAQVLTGVSPQDAIKVVAADPTLKVNITPANYSASVSSVSAINVTTVVGTAPVLPATVSANLTDGTAKSVKVTWAAVAPASYAATGSFTVTGTIAESASVKATANVKVNPASVLQISSTKANLVLGNLSVTVNDATKVAKVMVNGTQVTVTPLGNVYTVPISDITDYVVFVGTDGVNVVAQGTAPAAPALTASSKTYNGLLGFESVTVNNSALVASVTIGTSTYTIGAAVGADGIAASVVDATHIKVTGLTAAPATIILVPASGSSVTI